VSVVARNGRPAGASSDGRICSTSGHAAVNLSVCDCYVDRSYELDALALLPLEAGTLAATGTHLRELQLGCGELDSTYNTTGMAQRAGRQFSVPKYLLVRHMHEGRCPEV